MRIRLGPTASGNWALFISTRLLRTACPRFYSLSHLARTWKIALTSSKICSYMLQQDEILVMIICLYRQIQREKKANRRSSQKKTSGIQNVSYI